VPVPVAHAPGASFPSGHATTAAAAALVVIVLTWPHLAGRARWLVASGAALVAVAVSFSRLILGVHFLSDVVGGCLAAAAVVFGLVALLRVDWAGRRPFRRSRAASP
jgi:membrane-associated phospholipid phosphatase